MDQSNEDPPEPQNNEDPIESQTNEDPTEPQAILANGAMTVGIVKFTVPSDGMKIVSTKTLHDKLNPKVVMNKVDVKRVGSVEL